MRRRRGRGSVVFVDFPVYLLAVFIALFILTEAPTQKPPTIETPGVLALSDTWSAGSNEDIDMYVRDPSGTLVYFADPSEGLMHLEYDDLGTAVTGVQTLPDGRKVTSSYNGERVIMTGVVPGEYSVNIQMYLRKDVGTTPVVVQLWLLRGDDRLLLQQKLSMGKTGDEQTAFRFTLDASGQVTTHNRLPVHLVAIANGDTVIP